MREVKYRAWDKINKEMVKVVTIHFDNRYIRGLIEVGEHMDLESSYNFDDIILMQYTGIKGSDDVDIYEGDIVEDEHGRHYLVRFKCGTVLFGSCNAMGFLNSYQSFNVINNIYENN